MVLKAQELTPNELEIIEGGVNESEWIKLTMVVHWKR